MIEKLEELDRQLLLLLNGNGNSVLDFIMSSVSYSVMWIPLYIIMLFVAYKKFGWKTMLLLFAIVGLAVGTGDRVSVMGFKEVFMRYRPCHNLDIGMMVNLVNDKCGGMYGFVSSHATNHFIVAMVFGLAFRKLDMRWLFWLVVWAAVIGYSRIYLGVHYPGDVVCGTLLGCGIGCAYYLLFKFAHTKLKL